jgi:predicted AAA+ superfamily ATPase
LGNALAGKIAKPIEIIIGDDLVGAVLVGGYPEMLRREDQKRRRAWARAYVKAIVERDIFLEREFAKFQMSVSIKWITVEHAMALLGALQFRRHTLQQSINNTFCSY